MLTVFITGVAIGIGIAMVLILIGYRLPRQHKRVLEQRGEGSANG